MAAGKKGVDVMLELAKRLLPPTGFDKAVQKVKFTSAGGGKCSAELKLDQDHANVYGVLHGGMAATLVEIISSLAMMTHEKGKDHPGASVEIHVRYLKGAKIGQDIVINANTLKLGKTLAFLEVELLDKNSGDLIAKGSHTKYVG